MLRGLYLLIGLLVIGGYGYTAWNGLELTPTKKRLTQQGVRSTAGGATYYRGGGYRGGK